MDEEVITVSAEESGDRVDALLSLRLEGVSRSAVQRLIESGAVTRKGLPVRKNDRVTAGDLFEVVLPEVADVPLVAQEIPLDIRYEDDSVIVINKPRGLVVHPAPGHPDGTLVNALLWHCADSLSGIGGEKRPGIVHRIDKDTSGLLIVAKNDRAHAALSAQLSDRSLSRTYEAVARGTFREAAGTVDRPIGRDANDRKKMAVTEKNSRSAVTDWELLSQYAGYAHIRCHLRTGRTHQIRVHMASIGHPLLGDALYGGRSPEKGLEGQCLHARALKFIHPETGRQIVIETELPEYFTEVLHRLGPALE